MRSRALQSINEPLVYLRLIPDRPQKLLALDDVGIIHHVPQETLFLAGLCDDHPHARLTARVSAV